MYVVYNANVCEKLQNILCLEKMILKLSHSLYNIWIIINIATKFKVKADLDDACYRIDFKLDRQDP